MKTKLFSPESATATTRTRSSAAGADTDHHLRDSDHDSDRENENDAVKQQGAQILRPISATVKKLAETVHNIVGGVISAGDEAREKTMHICAKLYRIQVRVLKCLLSLRAQEVEPIHKALLTFTAEKLTPSIHSFLTKVTMR
jgi:hypothetical protein